MAAGKEERRQAVKQDLLAAVNLAGVMVQAAAKAAPAFGARPTPGLLVVAALVVLVAEAREAQMSLKDVLWLMSFLRKLLTQEDAAELARTAREPG